MTLNESFKLFQLPLELGEAPSLTVVQETLEATFPAVIYKESNN